MSASQNHDEDSEKSTNPFTSTNKNHFRSLSNNYQPMVDSQEPIEDPSNSAEVNAKRKQELEAVRALNSAVQTINSNLENAKTNLQQFKQTMNQTNQLLDMWILILSQTEHTKRLMEDPDWEGGQLDAKRIDREVQESQREKNERKQMKMLEAQRQAVGEEKGKAIQRPTATRSRRGDAPTSIESKPSSTKARASRSSNINRTNK